MTREELVDTLTGWPIGTGYYATTVGPAEAQDMADEILADLTKARAEAWDEGFAEGVGEHFNHTTPNPYRKDKTDD